MSRETDELRINKRFHETHGYLYWTVSKKDIPAYPVSSEMVYTWRTLPPIFNTEKQAAVYKKDYERFLSEQND